MAIWMARKHSYLSFLLFNLKVLLGMYIVYLIYLIRFYYKMKIEAAFQMWSYMTFLA